MQQLKFYLRAVGNAILDNKMHCAKMTDEEALDFLMPRDWSCYRYSKVGMDRGGSHS